MSRSRSKRINVLDDEDVEDHNTECGAKRLKGQLSYIEQLSELRRGEVNKTMAVADMNLSDLLDTADYWVERREVLLQKTGTGSDEEKIERAKEFLRAAKRVYCLIQKLNELVPIKDSNKWPSDTHRTDTPKEVRETLQQKKDNLTRTDFEILNDPNPCDMGVDSFYEALFRKNIWDKLGRAKPKEEHASLKVYNMDVTTRCEALASLLECRVPNIMIRKGDIKELKKEKLRHGLELWARIICLYHTLKNLPPRDSSWLPAVRECDGGVSGFKKKVTNKLTPLGQSMKKLCDEADGTEEDKHAFLRELLISIGKRDPEYRRVLKIRFEEILLDSKTLYSEAWASKNVVDLTPVHSKGALEWFVDRNEDKRTFANDMERRAAFLRDWKRVLALKLKVEECLATEEGERLVEPSDSLPKDITKMANVKIEIYASEVKKIAVADAKQQKVEDLKMDRDSTFKDAFESSYSRLLKV